ncbi:alpha-taxilin [Coccinella septempunctata]|uniref:alpha-taxilin n=1 Tax=Coccinella septempunctata TaxID=41139 RepID=UPI001D061133|nr:alpha-taxilin [Coccinella septempunctata]XP_044765424.1 alpha-taxilin [Coccinella septempunctata]
MEANNTQIPNPIVSENKRREQKYRKKDPRSWYNISKSIAELSEAEKLTVLEKKYIELYNEHRNYEVEHQEVIAKYQLLSKEKDHISNELAKSIDIRTRLESVCRELQKQNKTIKEENALKLKLEEDRRKEVTSQFQRTLNDINTMMDENQVTNMKLQDDNLDMSVKIAELYQQFESRESALKKLNKQMDLEKQLVKANIAKTEYEFQAEREIWKKEMQFQQAELAKSKADSQVLEQTIKKLEEHLNVYKEQYENFEGTLTKSNKMFADCKDEMLKMTRKIASLDKDALNWKKRFENAAQTIVQLTNDKHQQEIEVINTHKKLQQLQKLCRQLQLDRASYLKLLKANKIEPVSEIIEQEPADVPEKSSKKEIELKHLQSELKFIQSQLNLVDKISNSENTQTASPLPVDKANETKP